MKYRKIGFAFSMLAGGVIAVLLNLTLVQELFTPDPCYYHNRKTNFFFNFFYKLSAENGDHPIPTLFNLLVSLVIGMLVGLWFKIIISEQKNNAKF
ncbi:hypothetical protein [Pedobacter sp. Hv1]|uniref:hypothetical protein n=1 Tax=Pedobacter sp. Hv1 TaxID=1740090 RepID=UPI0006D8CE31|nr:hypothetical protein [Pedobacter sp. Hv1]KQC02793.1 hypothetical protein AQF98_04255 [Pedobacter sp. Hv1]